MNKYPILTCPHDLEIMKCLSEIQVQQHEQAVLLIEPKLPIYICSQCGRRYTLTNYYEYMGSVMVDGSSFINLCDNPKTRKYGISIKFKTKARKRCVVYRTEKPLRCAVRGCDSWLETIVLNLHGRKGKYAIENASWCPSCSMTYISIKTYNQFPGLFECLYKEGPKSLPETGKLKIVGEKQQDIKQHNRYLEIIEKDNQQKSEWMAAYKRALEKTQEQKKREVQRKKEQKIKKQQNSEKAIEKPCIYEPSIYVQDFVIRRNAFKCRHKEHKLQNVDAVISIINKEGNIVQKTVPAGYCPNCHVFFIIDSTYEKIRNIGTPVCRVCDEKTYLKGSHHVGGMKLAQESILMQYGYSVSQQEGLTLARRRKILAVIINYKILTKSEILSYLDFFINQRQHQPKYESAISKWKEDREFVSGYNQGHYSEYFVNELHRRK